MEIKVRKIVALIHVFAYVLRRLVRKQKQKGNRKRWEIHYMEL